MADIVHVVFAGLLTVDTSPANADLLEGQSQLITCTITGEPAVRSIIWYFTPTGSTKQQILSTDNTAKYYGGNAQNPSVSIMNFQSFDGGTYFCSAINVVGQSNSTYTVLRFISKYWYKSQFMQKDTKTKTLWNSIQCA